ncbi:FecR family protein [Pseudomonas fluorescens]|uniref:Protein FecR n=1 Tax=Pseudomonas fluorescens TaxID=294 RepID=A0A5E7AJI0_PSEFL|nr:FecR family protein [Pseudomonas fluorescens]VVN76667.1 Protein FecR [Pseudomonas fluorescens]
MHERLPTHAVEPDAHRVAHAWVIRLTSGAVLPADIAAARAWCEQDPAHQTAFIEARHLWQLSGQLSVPVAKRSFTRHWAMASAAVLVLGLSLLLVRQNAWDADYRTAQGEQKQIQLADGSRIILDSDSALDVQLTPNGRQMVLRKGEALFDVAHDPGRPFSVQAGDLRATALGTVYAVRREGAQAQVTVARGRVAVSAAAGKVVLQAGEAVARQANGLGAKHQVDTDKALAWQHGRLVFELTPLAQVLKEIERYRPGFILISDDRLRDLKVSGSFRLDRLDGGLAALEQVFPLKIERYTDYLLVLKPRG